jgi:type I restriction enzyme S subunit
MNADRLLAYFDRITDAPDAVARLRRFILDLAVRGKLVEQDPNDEPASELLKRIQAEKARLLKTRQIRNEPTYPAVEQNETPYSAPAGWAWARIRQVTSDRGHAIPDKEFTYIDVTSIDKENGRIADPKVLSASEAPSRARKLVGTGDVLYSCVRPYLLNIATVEVDIVPSPIASTAFAVLNGFGLVLPRYLWTALRSPLMIGFVEAKMRGQAYPAINDSDFAMLPLPIPPFAEQQRIVAKVDELMARCDRLGAAQVDRERRRDRLAAASLRRLSQQDESSGARHEHARFYLTHLPGLTVRTEQIKDLRHAVLSLAVRGRLAQQDTNDEPAIDLIRLARREPRLPGYGRKDVEGLPPIDSARAPFNLPRGWAWARFPEVGTFGRGKSKHRPRNDPTLFAGGTHLFVQTGDVARCDGVIETYTGRYNATGLAQSFKWPKGTMCITIAANIADSGILSFDACFPDSVVGFVPATLFHDARYFEYFLRTAKANLTDFAPATAQKNINIEILSAVLIPLPPLAEQRRIVAKVDELMAICDRLEEQISAGASISSRLLDALLHEVLGTGIDQKGPL